MTRSTKLAALRYSQLSKRDRKWLLKNLSPEASSALIQSYSSLKKDHPGKVLAYKDIEALVVEYGEGGLKERQSEADWELDLLGRKYKKDSVLGYLQKMDRLDALIVLEHVKQNHPDVWENVASGEGAPLLNGSERAFTENRIPPEFVISLLPGDDRPNLYLERDSQ